MLHNLCSIIMPNKANLTVCAVNLCGWMQKTARKNCCIARLDFQKDAEIIIQHARFCNVSLIDLQLEFLLL